MYSVQYKQQLIFPVPVMTHHLPMLAFRLGGRCQCKRPPFGNRPGSAFCLCRQVSFSSSFLQTLLHCTFKLKHMGQISPHITFLQMSTELTSVSELVNVASTEVPSDQWNHKIQRYLSTYFKLVHQNETNHSAGVCICQRENPHGICIMVILELLLSPQLEYRSMVNCAMASIQHSHATYGYW